MLSSATSCLLLPSVSFVLTAYWHAFAVYMDNPSVIHRAKEEVYSDVFRTHGASRASVLSRSVDHFSDAASTSASSVDFRDDFQTLRVPVPLSSYPPLNRSLHKVPARVKGISTHHRKAESYGRPICLKGDVDGRYMRKFVRAETNC